MTTTAPCSHEHALAAHTRRIRRYLRGSPLPLEPRVELLARLGNNEERHVRVLQSAKLRTLAAIHAGSVRFDRDACRVTGSEIALAAQIGYPEAVNHVVASELDGDLLADG